VHPQYFFGHLHQFSKLPFYYSLEKWWKIFETVFSEYIFQNKISGKEFPKSYFQNKISGIRFPEQNFWN